jgi:hypothetical protein
MKVEVTLVRDRIVSEEAKLILEVDDDARKTEICELAEAHAENLKNWVVVDDNIETTVRPDAFEVRRNVI